MMNLASKKNQSGVVLILGLIMLLLLTVIGMTAIRGSTLEERMVGNMRDRNVAFQSAEAGLRAAEVVLNGLARPSFGGGVPGYGPMVAHPGSATFWENFAWGAKALQPALGIANVNTQPQYYIEAVNSKDGDDPTGAVDFESNVKAGGSTSVFRVTSRAEGGSADTVVILQSTYRTGG